MQKTNPSRLYRMNQRVTVNSIPCLVQGYMNSTDVVVRVKLSDLDKSGERYFTQFKCLTKRATFSCLYTIPENIVRQSNEQKGKAAKVTKKGA